MTFKYSIKMHCNLKCIPHHLHFRHFPKSGPRHRAVSTSELVWPEVLFRIFWNFSVVRHDRLLKKVLTVTFDVQYHKQTHVIDKYRSNHGKTVKSCGPLSLQDNARKHMTNQTKSSFYILHFGVFRHPPYSPNMATN